MTKKLLCYLGRGLRAEGIRENEMDKKMEIQTEIIMMALFRGYIGIALGLGSTGASKAKLF